MEINKISANLTKHQRHARLVKLTRKDYQLNHLGSRLFPNTSGVAWQGNAINGAGKVELLNPRPIAFGIPEPEIKGTGEKSGGTDLLGVTIKEIEIYEEQPNGYGAYRRDEDLPIFTAIECKTGKSRLKKNQKIFRTWVLSINGIYFISRECSECWDKWEPVKLKGKIIDWKIPPCPICGGVGYKLEG